MDERIEEILRRLEALERRVEQLAHGGCTASGCAWRGDERRLVDLIVALTAERVAERIAGHATYGGPHHHHHHGPPRCPTCGAHHGPPPPPPPHR